MSCSGCLDDEQQFRGWACFLQITIMATRGNYRLLCLPVGKENMRLVHCIPSATPRWSWLLDRKDGPALGRKRAGIFEKLPEKSSNPNNLGELYITRIKSSQTTKLCRSP